VFSTSPIFFRLLSDIRSHSDGFCPGAENMIIPLCQRSVPFLSCIVSTALFGNLQRLSDRLLPPLEEHPSSYRLAWTYPPNQCHGLWHLDFRGEGRLPYLGNSEIVTLAASHSEAVT